MANGPVPEVSKHLRRSYRAVAAHPDPTGRGIHMMSEHNAPRTATPEDPGPTVWALPEQPPLGTVVRINSHGEFVYFRNVGGEGGDWGAARLLELPHGAMCWAAGSSPEEIGRIPWWTWGQILDRGPVALVQGGAA